MGAHFQVPGLGNQEPATGDQVQVRATGLSIPPSVIDSAICHLQSIQSSIYFGWQVAAPSGGAFSIQPSTQSSVQSSLGSPVS